MIASAPSTPSRVDAVRNREAVLAAATRVFAASETEPSMRSIAREAQVGIATLYRHFPTREALVDAVYRDQVERLTTGAEALLRQYPAAEAMRRWMDLFGAWLLTKHGMIDTLRELIDAGAIPQADTRDELLEAISSITAKGAADGQLRGDVPAADIAATLLGAFTVAGRPDQREQLRRLLDLLLDGLRHPRPDPGPG